jgi:ferritin
MLRKAIQDAMNEQIKNELYSAHQYLSMSAYCESVALPGFAHWMLTQAHEAREHAMKFYNFIIGRDDRVVLRGINQPASNSARPWRFSSKRSNRSKRLRRR